MGRATTIDEALEMLARTGPEWGGGLSNHGPMGAEALVVLGRDDAVTGWVEQYKRRLGPAPEARDPIDPSAWREALGRIARVGDWAALFQRELSEGPWREVLDRWVRRLAPGIVAAGTHGVIRTAHAVRSLATEETPLRRRELAEGLAYWAARYQRLPGDPGAGVGGLRPSEAVRRLAPLGRPEPGERYGLITEWLGRLDGRAEFAGVIDLVDASKDPSAFLSDLTEAFAGVYLANAHTGQLIGFIHAVTGPRAVRLLAPHLSPDTLELALRYAWQAAAGMYAVFGERPDSGPPEERQTDVDDLIERAVATGDEHAIKFTEACLREHPLNPRPVYLAAAEHAVNALTPRR